MSWLAERLAGSIRARLLLTLCGGLGLLLLATFVLLDLGIDRQIHGRLDEALLGRARGIAVVLESHPPAAALAELQAFNPGYAGDGHTDFLQIWDARGRTLLASASNAAANLQPPPAAVSANAPLFYDLRLPDGHSGRAVALRLNVGRQGEDAVLAVAQERADVDALEAQVHLALVAAAIGTILLAALLAVLAVRGGLRPLLEFGARARGGEPAGEALPPARMPRELRPFAESLNAAFRQLREALERERRFARDVAHELRTPLAEMRMAVELAQRDAGDPAPLHGALGAIERMRRCIDGLLALSRYEAGLDRPQLEPLELAGLLRRALATAQSPAPRNAVRIEAVLPRECWVSSDTALLERIVDNLLLNAAEYAPPDSQVRVRLEPAGDGLRLCIENPAPALEAADLAHLGERFWRKSVAREASRHGGLGLALSHALAGVLGLRLAFALEHGVFRASLEPLREIAALSPPDS